jgi:ABC-type dipeptide/oligopeptide/nickel transport system ATPase subunit
MFPPEKPESHTTNATTHRSIWTMANQTLSILTNALASTPSLSAHLDEDTSEYILSILLDDPNDEDARDAVSAFFQGHDVDEAVCAQFFATLDASAALNGHRHGGGGGEGMINLSIHDQAAEVPLRRLDNAITLQSRDIVTFASGLVADADSSGLRDGVDDADGALSDIQSFYANMIDASDNPRATSERERRKERQREIRERSDEEERRRAIDDAARMMEEEGGMAAAGGGGAGGGVADGGARITANGDMSEMTTASDNAADVHLTGFNLCNRKGGGPDLLSDANMTLASGRRYGLMGRNGCGKTTLLTALASRELCGSGGGSVPQNMAMLLVRQEIMGNDLSAVETVLRSDVKREGVKRWIEHIERELNRLDDNSQEAGAVGGDGDGDDGAQQGAQQPSKGKQRLKDRKKKTATSSSAAGKKSTTSNEKGSSRQPSSPPSEEDAEEKRKRLNAKLALAYERLARIEQDEGGDPEPRARRVLFGLGFVTAEMQDKPTRELSGGWRMRVSLSCALFADPALLL